MVLMKKILASQEIFSKRLLNDDFKWCRYVNTCGKQEPNKNHWLKSTKIDEKTNFMRKINILIA